MHLKINPLLSAVAGVTDFAEDKITQAKELFALSLVKSGLDTLVTALETPAPTPTPSDDSSFIVHTSDKFQFGYLWPSIRNNYLDLVPLRRQEIKAQKEHWQDLIEGKKDTDKGFYLAIDKMVEEGSLVRAEDGAGAAYFLYDKKGIPRFVVKPVDEDILCLNNSKQLGSPLIERKYRVREDVPLYRSAQTDVVCYEVAKIMGIPEITPKTVMNTLSSEAFYDITDFLVIEDKETLLPIVGGPDKEKLCSVQEFIPHSTSLYEVYEEAVAKEVSRDEMAELFDQKDFENCNIFVWATYDTDAHPGNIRAYVKGFSPSGNPVYGLKKVDNGLAFPERNTYLVNFLPHLPNGDKPLSLNSRKAIAALPVSKIEELLTTYEMEACIPAFKERIEVLQELATWNGVSIYEIDLRMRALSILEDGRKIALSSISIKELEDIVFGDNTTSPSNPIAEETLKKAGE